MGLVTRYMVAMVLIVGALAPASADSSHYPRPSAAKASTVASTYVGTIPVRKLDPIAASLLVALKKPADNYTVIRPVILKGGWTPVVVKACKINVIGGDADERCKRNPPDKICYVCDQFPELEACSGDGYCLTQFSNPHSPLFLSVTTYDQIQEGEAVVVGIDFDKQALSD